MTFARSMMVLAALLASGMSPAVAQQSAPTAGRSITTLAQVPLKARDGTAILLGARVAPGKPTLIALWASWCMPCFAEAPHLDRIRKDLGSAYNFLYVNRREGDPDPDQPPAAIARLLAYGGMSDVDYVIADVRAYRQILGADIGNVPQGLIGIPRIYLFDRSGRQIYTSYGFQDADGFELERRVKQAVGT